MVSDFPDADGLAGAHHFQVDIALTEAQSAALRDGDGAIVEQKVQIWQAGIGAK